MKRTAKVVTGEFSGMFNSRIYFITFALDI